jgi:hypothetical protein
LDVQHRFPAHVYPKTAIDKGLARLLLRQLVKAQSFSDFRKMYEEMK